MRSEFRLKKQADFQRVRTSGRSWAHPLLVLSAAANDLDRSRVGIAVGKRVGKAVTRNRVKRRIREAVRARWREVLPGYDLVFIARAAAAEADWPTIRHAVDDLLRRARLLRDES